jgi:hypothetical protein
VRLIRDFRPSLAPVLADSPELSHATRALILKYHSKSETPFVSQSSIPALIVISHHWKSLRSGGSSAHTVYDPRPHMSAHPMSAHYADHLQIFGGGQYTPIYTTDTSFGGRGLETGLTGDAGMTPSGQNSCQNTQHFDKSGINSEMKRPVMRIMVQGEEELMYA